MLISVSFLCIIATMDIFRHLCLSCGRQWLFPKCTRIVLLYVFFDSMIQCRCASDFLVYYVISQNETAWKENTIGQAFIFFC